MVRYASAKFRETEFLVFLARNFDRYVHVHTITTIRAEWGVFYQVFILSLPLKHCLLCPLDKDSAHRHLQLLICDYLRSKHSLPGCEICGNM